MKKAEIENNLAGAEKEKAELTQQLQEIEDRIAYLENERKALAFVTREGGDADAIRKKRSIEIELGRLRQKQTRASDQIKGSEDMLDALNADLREAQIEEAQADRDRKALAVVEVWVKLTQMDKDRQEAADELDRRNAAVREAEIKLHSMTPKDYPAGVPFDPPIGFSEPANRLAELHRRRVELMSRLGIA